MGSQWQRRCQAAIARRAVSAITSAHSEASIISPGRRTNCRATHRRCPRIRSSLPKAQARASCRLPLLIPGAFRGKRVSRRRRAQDMAAQETQLGLDSDLVAVQERCVMPAGDPHDFAARRSLRGPCARLGKDRLVVVAHEDE